MAELCFERPASAGRFTGWPADFLRRCARGALWGAVGLMIMTGAAVLSAQRNAVTAAHADIGAQAKAISALRGALADSKAHSQNLALVASQLEQERADAAAAATAAKLRAERMRLSLATHMAKAQLRELAHRKALRQIERATQRGLTSAERALAVTGLSRLDVTTEIERDFSGRGGRNAEYRSEPQATGASDQTSSPIATRREDRLERDLHELADLRFALRLMPFGAPVAGARQTSGFGPRRDPFHRKKRVHHGVDFASTRGAPIHAAAPGKVVFSGWMRGYGQVVKIGHAFGFETVYAHLHQRRASVGDRVEQGSHIGDMGSTGRSTGVHLHYEIRLNGVAVNPVNYIEAARHVL